MLFIFTVLPVISVGVCDVVNHFFRSIPLSAVGDQRFSERLKAPPGDALRPSRE
jgi:hypothetical protein